MPQFSSQQIFALSAAVFLFSFSLTSAQLGGSVWQQLLSPAGQLQEAAVNKSVGSTKSVGGTGTTNTGTVNVNSVPLQTTTVDLGTTPVVTGTTGTLSNNCAAQDYTPWGAVYDLIWCNPATHLWERTSSLGVFKFNGTNVGIGANPVSNSKLNVWTNLSNQHAIYANSPSTAVFGQSNTGLGVYGVTQSGVALRGEGVGVNSLALQAIGPIEIVDGTQGEGKVLTSDANGLASWRMPTGGPNGDSFWALVTNTNGIRNTNLGGVGIGTRDPDPAWPLSVSGNNGINVLAAGDTGISSYGHNAGVIGKTGQGVGVRGTAEAGGIAVAAWPESPEAYGFYQEGSAAKNFFEGRLGLGVVNPDPAAMLDVLGQIKIRGGNPRAGRVLTSDAAGFASWQEPTNTGGPSLPVPTPGQTLRGGGLGNWVAESNLYNNGTNVGINTTSPTKKLTLNTNTPLDGLSVTNGSQWVNTFAGTLGQGSYNGIVQNGDNGMIFSGGDIASGSFVLAPWASGVRGLRMTDTGNVGLGTPTPTERLDLGGGNIKMGYEIVRVSDVVTSAMVHHVAIGANCPQGKYLISGGCTTSADGVEYPELSLMESGPRGNSQWHCRWFAPNNNSVGLVVEAHGICANIR